MAMQRVHGRWITQNKCAKQLRRGFRLSRSGDRDRDTDSKVPRTREPTSGDVPPSTNELAAVGTKMAYGRVKYTPRGDKQTKGHRT
jgi:hypothetical protein